ncbi:MAG: betaine--homocysteine S-methyltransferase [Anaerolineae bacterium]
MPDLLELLKNDHILIADGATGTGMQRLGLPPGRAPELWNAENPDAVRKQYRDYIEAGSNLILTNSFGGTRARLDLEGAGDRVHELNRLAAELAREVAGDQVVVLGSMGPTGQLMEPMGPLTYETCKAYFAEQAAALAEGGVDALLIETMSDLNEVKAAIEGARAVTDLPILATMSFDTHGRTMMGVKPEEAVKEIWGLGVAAVGANCGRTLSETLAAVQAMRRAVPEAILMAKPNAGLPRLENLEAVYDVTPEVMVEYAQKFADAGVKIFGGCCGSTPTHIEAVSQALAGRTVVKPAVVDGPGESDGAQAVEPGQRRGRRARRRRSPVAK